MLNFYSTGLVRAFNMLMCFVNLQWRAIAAVFFKFTFRTHIPWHMVWVTQI